MTISTGTPRTASLSVASADAEQPDFCSSSGLDVGSTGAKQPGVLVPGSSSCASYGLMIIIDVTVLFVLALTLVRIH
jgi:hypothetical protein